MGFGYEYSRPHRHRSPPRRYTPPPRQYQRRDSRDSRETRHFQSRRFPDRTERHYDDRDRRPPRRFDDYYLHSDRNRNDRHDRDRHDRYEERGLKRSRSVEGSQEREMLRKKIKSDREERKERQSREKSEKPEKSDKEFICLDRYVYLKKDDVPKEKAKNRIFEGIRVSLDNTKSSSEDDEQNTQKKSRRVSILKKGEEEKVEEKNPASKEHPIVSRITEDLIKQAFEKAFAKEEGKNPISSLFVPVT